MTPFQMQFIFDCNCRPSRTPECPIGKETVDFLLSANLIKTIGEPDPNGKWKYVLTDGGKFYLAALERVPAPVMTWTFP